MNKSRVCAKKTLELAKQQTCAKKTNLLVYEKTKQPCRPTTAYTAPITIPRVKRIKVCTGAQMKRMCAPPACPCPPKPIPPGLLKRIARLLGFGLKTLIALGAIYITYDMGIWGDSQRTQQLYQSLCQRILPAFCTPRPEKVLSPSCKAEKDLFTHGRRDPFCCDKFPIDSETSGQEMREKYNELVACTFASIVWLPNKISDWSRKAFCKIVDSESCKEGHDDCPDDS